jgi:hypothetical protein
MSQKRVFQTLNSKSRVHLVTICAIWRTILNNSLEAARSVSLDV